MKRRPTPSKAETRKADELSAAGLKRVLKDAGFRVAKENLQRGVAITVIQNGQLVRIRPDNSREVLNKKAEASVTLLKTRFRLG
ncbi:hypothetical protein ACVWYF_002305 [Hymenobacter sp. UYAg731]